MDMEDVGTKCRICGNRKGNEIYKCKDRRLTLSGGGIFRYLFCAHCGTLSLVDVPEDMGKYYRVAADTRGLNYDQYFVRGQVRTESDEAYTSHNTVRLDVQGTVEKILTAEYVQEQLKLKI